MGRREVDPALVSTMGSSILTPSAFHDGGSSILSHGNLVWPRGVNISVFLMPEHGSSCPVDSRFDIDADPWPAVGNHSPSVWYDLQLRILPISCLLALVILNLVPHVSTLGRFMLRGMREGGKGRISGNNYS